MAQSGSAPALGAGSRRFKSSHPDRLIDQAEQSQSGRLSLLDRILAPSRPSRAPVAQGIEQRISNPLVAGSIPARRASLPRQLLVTATDRAIPLPVAFSGLIPARQMHWLAYGPGHLCSDQSVSMRIDSNRGAVLWNGIPKGSLTPSVTKIRIRPAFPPFGSEADLPTWGGSVGAMSWRLVQSGPVS